MDRAISLGPLALSLNILIWMGSLWFGLWVASRVARRHAVHMYWQTYAVLVLGLTAARLGFVVQHLDTYLANPITILNIRDGGWQPWAGFAAVAFLMVVAALRRSPQARPIAAGLATVLLLGMGTTTGMRLTSHQTPELASFSVADMNGQSLDLQTFHGKPLVVNLWASWCPPCVREMPVLQQAQLAHPDVAFVFLNQGESVHQIQTFLDRHHMVFDNLLLDRTGEVGRAYGSQLLPTTLFFDANGKLVDLRLGELSKATLAQRLEQISH
ncbi:TlpA disulfide reductase family protein [Orrella marina]|uniref:Thioredoxin domain-containing protein n=1 Tax=Orrella marina TaxID=2163011 RepID=A0A2R4XHZ3_9BURK|nr:TlpA disulfide reductase family protein [Orrella marina]AWB33421.1 hypothetical protein DBV39_06545 [Orrella marina]